MKRLETILKKFFSFIGILIYVRLVYHNHPRRSIRLLAVVGEILDDGSASYLI